MTNYQKQGDRKEKYLNQSKEILFTKCLIKLCKSFPQEVIGTALKKESRNYWTFTLMTLSRIWKLD